MSRIYNRMCLCHTSFMQQLESAKRQLVLDTGLWRYSRHPNHFGEQLWWVGLALLGVDGGGVLAFVGVLYNHPIDIFVTLGLIENRMLANRKSSAPRTTAFKEYQDRTSYLVPWPPSEKSHSK